LTIGRSYRNDIQIYGEGVSRVHCRIERAGADYQVLDLNSINGTEVNGRPVVKQCLHHGDRLQLADAVFVFERQSPSGNWPSQETKDLHEGQEACFQCGEYVPAEEVAKLKKTYGDLVYCEICLRTGPLVGRTLGHFTILSKISQGSMGAVYRARQSIVDRIVAFKILKKALAEKDSMIKRFLRGAAASARMNHPNIIQLYDIGEEEGFYYIAMEYVDGPTVGDVLELQGFQDLHKVISIGAQTAKALQHAFKNRIVHRDVKPSNILLTRNGLAKLTDFGLAKPMDEAGMSGITAAGATMGSLNYMSPEHIHDAKWADQRSDVYSLGATMYHMLTGEAAFPGSDLVSKVTSIQNEEPPSPKELRPEVPDALCRLIQRMMAKKPDDRYQTPKEVVSDLRTIRNLLSRQPVST